MNLGSEIRVMEFFCFKMGGSTHMDTQMDITTYTRNRPRGHLSENLLCVCTIPGSNLHLSNYVNFPCLHLTSKNTHPGCRLNHFSIFVKDIYKLVQVDSKDLRPTGNSVLNKFVNLVLNSF